MLEILLADLEVGREKFSIDRDIRMSRLGVGAPAPSGESFGGGDGRGGVIGRSSVLMGEGDCGRPSDFGGNGGVTTPSSLALIPRNAVLERW